MLRRTPALLACCALTVALIGTTAGTAAADDGSTDAVAERPAPPKDPVSVGRGGAVSSVDPYASRIGRRVLARGGNAVDAAVATAAALGVTEPYSAGIGGGGYFVFYNATTGEVTTIDGRETAPAAMESDAFIDPDTGKPYPFTPDLVTSGVSVGVPGTPATWDEGARPLGHAVAAVGADARRPAGPRRLRRRPDLPPADQRERGPVPHVRADVRPVPRRRRAGGRQPVPQPRPGPHLRAARQPGHGLVLRRSGSQPRSRRPSRSRR